jgi:hypothetical protein
MRQMKVLKICFNKETPQSFIFEVAAELEREMK